MAKWKNILKKINNKLGETMDINKWKSVAVKKETHTMLTALCTMKERNPARMISKLVNDYVEFQAKKAKKPIDAFKKELLSKNANK